MREDVIIIIMDKKLDLIGFGDPFLDLVIEIDKLPESNTNCPMLERCFQGGGNVATALAAASRLGLKTSLIGSVGDDLFGKMSLSDLEYNKIDVSKMVVRKDRKSNFSVCVAERAVKGKEFIVGHGDFEQIEPEGIDEEYISSAKMLHTGLITPAVIKACECIHKAGGKVSIDAPYYKPFVYENYKHFDIFIGSEMYYDEMCRAEGYNKYEYENNMNTVREQGCEIVIFTFGGDGCRGVYEDKYFEIPAMEVEVVDTTGAGDVFHGAFDYAYLQGWNTEECARFSTAVSAIKCTRPGGRSGIPTLDVLEKFLKTGEIDYSEIDERVAHYKRGII